MSSAPTALTGEKSGETTTLELEAKFRGGIFYPANKKYNVIETPLKTHNAAPVSLCGMKWAILILINSSFHITQCMAAVNDI